jgi:hypothetical protein
MKSLFYTLFFLGTVTAIAQRNAVLFEGAYLRVTSKYSTFLQEERVEVAYEVLDKAFEKTIQVKAINATLIDSLHSPLVLQVKKGNPFVALYFYSLDGESSQSLATVWIPVRMNHASTVILKSEDGQFFVTPLTVGGSTLQVAILVGENTIDCKSFYIRRGTATLSVNNTAIMTKEIYNTNIIDLKPFWNRSSSGGNFVVKINRYSCRLEDGREIEPVLDEATVNTSLSRYAPTKSSIYMTVNKK